MLKSFIKQSNKEAEAGSRPDQSFLAANKLFTNTKVMIGICIFIFIAVFLAINMLFQAVGHIGDMIKGTFETYMLFTFSASLLPIYLFALLAAGVLSILFVYRIKTGFGELNIGQKGHARFMTEAEISQRFQKIPCKIKRFDGYGGAAVARDGEELYIDTELSNLLIVAVTRSGKTEILVYSTIDIISRAEHQSSMIIPDVKGEISRACIPHLLDRGYDVAILDFFDSNYSMFYNPLDVIAQCYQQENVDLAQELCFAMASVIFEEKNIRDPYWVEAPKALFVAAVLAQISDCLANHEPEKITPYSVYTFINVMSKLYRDPNSDQNELDRYFLSRDANDPAALIYSTIEFSQGRTRGSLLSVAASKLEIFSRNSVAKATSKNTISLSSLGFGKPTALFIRLPFYTRSYDPLISILISQAFYVNMDLAAKNKKHPGKMNRRVRVIGDEFFNFPKLYRLDNMLTVCLGAGWSFDLYAQSYAQIEQSYGKELAEIINDNCSTTYFLASPSKKSRQKFSENLGNVTASNVSRMGERLSLHKQITESFDEKQLIPWQELTELKYGDMMVFPMMKKKDLKGNPVIPRPIYNKGESRMRFRHEYMPEFDPAADIPYDRLNITIGEVNTVDLNQTLFLPISEEVAENHPAPLQPNDTFNNEEIKLLQNMIPLPINYRNISVSEIFNLAGWLRDKGEISEIDFENIKQLLSSK